MAELYQVYGGLGLGGNSSMEHFQSEQEDEEEEVPQRKPRQKQGGQPQQMPQQQPQQQMPQQASQQQQAQPQQKEQFQNMYAGNRRDSYSFFDKMSMKRADVVKLAVFSLVIVLAIAIDRMGTHYLTKYISDNIFTNFQEFMIRLSYPIVVFLVIWIVKSL
jgi:hypothetical protein